MQPEHITAKRVLYGCLDWGSGHLARSIPLLLQLERQGNSVFFCGSAAHHKILQQYGFTGKWLALPETGFRFRGDGNFAKEALRNTLALQRAIHRDRKAVESYVRQHEIDLVISDHRYGLRSKTVPGIFITHQVQLPPGTNRFAQRLHRNWMKRFDTIWILDDELEGLAGELSAARNKNEIYIGYRSRFKGVPVTADGGTVAIVSGPEPYARQLFDEVIAKACNNSSRWTIVCPEAYIANDLPANVELICNDWQQADDAIRRADLVVSRNGYSTLMDLKILGKKALLVPTPGQTEQLYLARINRNPDWTIVEKLSAPQVNKTGRL